MCGGVGRSACEQAGQASWAHRGFGAGRELGYANGPGKLGWPAERVGRKGAGLGLG